MCGIAGYFGTQSIPAERVKACLSLMRRRGPDAAAHAALTTASGKNFLALHSRLSIIDLDERSNQPFRPDAEILTFNGEIYNYVEKRAELAKAGQTFRTESDTEVLYRLLQRHGVDKALDLCEGMWAFAWLDPKKETLVLARDRFGEKPLFVLREKDGLYFGSEPKFLAALSGRRLSPNHNQILRYLVHGYKALYKGRETFFEELSEVPTGSFLEVAAGGATREQRYWTPHSIQNDSLSYAAAVEKCREEMIRSVKIRLRADVPLAFCMSGGVDSNSLIAVARNVLQYDVHGFTIANKDKRYEEQEMIDYSVKELGIRHTQVALKPDGFLGNLRELVRYHDSPVSTITYYAHWLLMEQIHNAGYKISISGTAADELFTGYFDHHLFYLASLQGDPAFAATRRAEWERSVKPIVRNRLLQSPEVFAENPGFRDHIFMDADEFRSYLHEDWREAWSEESFTQDNLRNRMMNEIFHEIVPCILHEDDLNAMYFSIENRSPFLDRGLFDFAFSVPTKYLVRDGMAKVLLRDSMRGIVPARILDNPRKVGFNAPISDLLDLKDPAVEKAVLADGPIYRLVKPEAIRSLLAKRVFSENESKFLFYFLSSKLFLEEFT